MMIFEIKNQVGAQFLRDIQPFLDLSAGVGEDVKVRVGSRAVGVSKIKSCTLSTNKFKY